jgi:hypothetical protein
MKQGVFQYRTTTNVSPTVNIQAPLFQRVLRTIYT